jgi:hypothetical protein
MTDKEIYQAQSAEIRRLHRVCQTKDAAIQKAIKAFEELKHSFHCNKWEFADNMINELKDNLG